ncbi:MAG TPA: hypothetical protein ENH85_07105 [Candidatus Scalindua sp.]|nr:hypothetical protein [Candidatus Scalindua sp.]
MLNCENDFCLTPEDILKAYYLDEYNRFEDSSWDNSWDNMPGPFDNGPLPWENWNQTWGQWNNFSGLK